MTRSSQNIAFDPNTTEYESLYADAGGIGTHYLQSGSGDPLVLIHGGGPGADCYGNWYSCMPGFRERFHTIAVDMVGFGRTDKPDPDTFTYSQNARTDHMIAFIEALDTGPVSLVGNSMGGLTGLCVAVKRPDLVSRMVLMGPAGIKQAPSAIAPLLNYDGTGAAMRAVIAALTHGDFQIDDEILDYRVNLSNEEDAQRAQAAAMRWIGERGGLYVDDDVIAGVACPTLLVGGKNDPIVTPRQLFRFLELIDNAWCYVLPHCGHWAMIEYPEEFVDVASRFLVSH